MSMLCADTLDFARLLRGAGIRLLWHPALSLADGVDLVDLLHDAIAGRERVDALCIEGAMLRGPQGSARWAAGQWHRLAWRASAGRVAVSFDDLSLGSVAVTGPLAALVLAVTADPGEEVMSLDDVEITVPQ